MRTRDEIEQEHTKVLKDGYPIETQTYVQYVLQRLQLEVLLDIREHLINTEVIREYEEAVTMIPHKDFSPEALEHLARDIVAVQKAQLLHPFDEP